MRATVTVLMTSNATHCRLGCLSDSIRRRGLRSERTSTTKLRDEFAYFFSFLGRGGGFIPPPGLPCEVSPQADLARIACFTRWSNRQPSLGPLVGHVDHQAAVRAGAGQREDPERQSSSDAKAEGRISL